MSLISKRINHKLVFMFILVTLIPLIAVTAFSVYKIVDALETDAVTNLVSTRKDKSLELYDYFHEIRKDLLVLSRQESVIEALGSQTDTRANKDQFIHSTEFILLFLKTFDFPGVVLLKANDLTPTFFAGHSREEAEDIARHPEVKMKSRQALDSGKIQVIDYIKLKTLKNDEMFAVSPVVSNGKTVGVVVLQLNSKHLEDILDSNLGLGSKGEVTLVGKDRFSRSDCQFVNELTTNKKKFSSPEIDKVFAGESLEYSALGHHNWKAMISCAPLNLKKGNRI